MAEAYFQASQRRIGLLYHRNSLVIAQCSFLTAVYLMSTMQILAAWKCFVQAGTQCLAWLTLASTSDRRNLELAWFFYLAEIALKRITHNVVS